MALPKIILTWALFGAALAGRLCAFEKAGFLGVGSAGQAMGGAHMALGEDLNDAFLNPAALTLLHKFGAGTTLGSDLSGLTQHFALLALSPSDFSGLAMALGVRRLRVDASGHAEDTWLASFALPFTDDGATALGLSLKLLSSDFVDPARGFGIDFGFHSGFHTWQNQTLSFGLSVLDLDTLLLHQSNLTEPIPQLVKLGMAYRFDATAALAVDQDFINDLRNPGAGSWGTHAGFEKGFLENKLCGRLGLSFWPGNAARLSAGAGYRWDWFTVDYAYLASSGELGSSHRLSVRSEFNLPAQAPPAGAPPPAPPLLQAPVVGQVWRGDGLVFLNWRPSAVPVRSYRFYLSREADQSFTRVAETNDTQVSLEIRGLPNGTPYWLRLSAVDAKAPYVESGPSAAVSFTAQALTPELAQLVHLAEQAIEAGRLEEAYQAALQAKYVDPQSAEAEELCLRLRALSQTAPSRPAAEAPQPIRSVPLGGQNPSGSHQPATFTPVGAQP